LERVIVYIDGFNLYYGLRSKGWRRYYWLDCERLARNLLKPNQRLGLVRYFTARISGSSGDPQKPKRQSVFLEALATLPNLTISYGHYLTKRQRCSSCANTWEIHEEKMTDVNIAVALLEDALDDRFDTAILVSGDSDLTAPVEAIRRRYPKKRVVVAFPPDRHSAQLARAASATVTIGRTILKDSQLPDRVQKSDGYVLKRPSTWR